MLAQTVINDVVPLLNTPGGAPHAVNREVFSYVDYLGALYAGTSKVKCGSDGLAEVRVRFTKFLQDVMARTDANYGTQAEVVYQMYRNGPVHEFDPKLLKNTSNQVLAWFSYRGPREDTFKEWNMSVRHLRPVQAPHNAGLYYLPVSTVCLIQDLLSSIEHFRQGISNTQLLASNWNEAATVLNQPKAFEFTVP